MAYAANRTLVLPPILRQSELSFGPPEIRCRNSTWQGNFQHRANALYAGKAATSTHESLRDAFSFADLEALGMRVIDFYSLAPSVLNSLAAAPLAPLGCAREDRYTARTLREALRPLDSAPTMLLGSAYFLKVDFEGLRHRDPCFNAVSDAVLHLPPAPRVRAAASAAIRSVSQPFASVHVRLSDGGVVAASASSTEVQSALAARQLLNHELQWLNTRLGKRLPRGRSHVYVATNAPGGVRSPLLTPLCGGATRGAGASTSLVCFDLTTLNATRTSEWGALIERTVTRASKVMGGVSSATAALLLDQAIGAQARLGFFSTSKFCGPAGFRKSTFSEGIALRWQQRHRAGQPPLCAHAMERALLQGRVAHGDLVY